MDIHTNKHKRILLKLSGEILIGPTKFGIDYAACQSVAHSLKKIHDNQHELGIVIGGGNIFRGINLKELGMPRTPSDHVGMLATLMNGIVLQQALESIGCQSKVMSAIECPQIASSYRWSDATNLLKEGKILIFVGGTGNPYFTTDTAAALRASEIQADVLLKATKVDGIYNKDPIKHPDAVKYGKMSYSQFLAEKLEVMDATSVALCRNNHIPILVFNMQLLECGQINIASLIEKGTYVEEH
ncbi:UMP kinase [Parachlamydia acanthamoebae]|uniref:Uridylate kinase n=2 Tax=Parachlamydia acanthamoebae TaxID=83552 RepID=F8KUS2_PARAV|nr:UMP kinase [Parachlamydia acanthamoebae]KIA76563.1 Uridylate kinase [Parachlamydia acanthamoebae]CCB84987.1 uridylate kinase [Parachlamydia acanthamoebae UV-7]